MCVSCVLVVSEQARVWPPNSDGASYPPRSATAEHHVAAARCVWRSAVHVGIYICCVMFVRVDRQSHTNE